MERMRHADRVVTQLGTPLTVHLGPSAASKALARIATHDKSIRELSGDAAAALRSRLHVVPSQRGSAQDADALERLWARAYCPEHELRCAQQTVEHAQLFERHGSKLSWQELRADLVAKVLSALSLRRDDHFVDLGCSAGRLAVVAAMCTSVSSVEGVDLNPSRLELAREAALRLGIGARVAFHEADLRDHPLHRATVAWCAPHASTAARLATQVVGRLQSERPRGHTTRLLLAGALLPEAVAPLSRAYLFEAAKGAKDEFAVLYGGSTPQLGPRLVAEYRIEGLVDGAEPEGEARTP